MVRILRVRLLEDIPVPPKDADFAFEIDFKKGEGEPRRIFDSASILIDAFETLDQAFLSSIDSKIEPAMVLEDVEAGSLKVWLRNILTRVDDEALKSLDWKKQVGKFLLNAKYIVLEWLDEKDEKRPSLDYLKDRLRKMAEETNIRYLPDYTPVHEGKLIAGLDRVQNAKRELGPGDKLLIETESRTYEVDLSSTWEPSGSIQIKDMQQTSSEGEIIFTIRKPDFIKDTMWQFSLGKINISAPINDDAWLNDFKSRKIVLLPGDALRCKVKSTFIYDEKGALIEQKYEIEKVLEIIKGSGPQLSFA